MMTKKLNPAQRHILRLMAKDRDKTGWTKVSPSIFKQISEAIPPELAIFRMDDKGEAKACLTEKGQAIVDAMEWL